MPPSLRLVSRVLRAVLASTLFPLVLVAVVGVAAGRLDLPFVWALGGLLAVYWGVTLLAMDPSLAAERVRLGPGARDRVLRRLLVPASVRPVDHCRPRRREVPLVGRHPDRAPGGRARGPRGRSRPGFVGDGGSNRFCSCAVRIQAERGHTVVTGGPYRFIRHPAYLAGLVAALAGSLVLGSWLSLLPALLFAGIERVAPHPRGFLPPPRAGGLRRVRAPGALPAPSCRVVSPVQAARAPNACGEAAGRMGAPGWGHEVK